MKRVLLLLMAVTAILCVYCQEPNMNKITSNDNASDSAGKSSDSIKNNGAAKKDSDTTTINTEIAGTTTLKKNDTAEKGTRTILASNKIMLLNAFNFDFSSNLSASYLGLFNVYAPRLIPCKIHHPIFRKITIDRIGMNAGIQKSKYDNNLDSASASYKYLNMLQNSLDYYQPADTLRTGAKYTAYYNKYNVTYTNSEMSFFVQFMGRLNFTKDHSKTGTAQLYLHLHIELVANDLTQQVSYQHIAADSSRTVSAANHPADFYINNPDNPVMTRQKVLSSYLGLGLTFTARPFKKDFFMVQGTFGWAINTPDFKELSQFTPKKQKETDASGPFFYLSGWRSFFLVKSTFMHQFNEDSQIVIGFTERVPITGQIYTQYAAYVGLNLGIEHIVNTVKNLLTGNK